MTKEGLFFQISPCAGEISGHRAKWTREKQMVRFLWAILFLAAPLLVVPALTVEWEGEFGEALERIDAYHYVDDNEVVAALLEDQLSRVWEGPQRGEILWRKARSLVAVADLSLWQETMEKDEASALYDEAHSYAEMAAEFFPDHAQTHFWLAATAGRRAQLRGIFNSLFQASTVRDYLVDALERDPELAEGYYVLGQVYRELPGWPISFGSNDGAVSLGRRAIDLYEEQRAAGLVPVRYFDHYIDLATSLWTRNNSVRKRERRQNRMAEAYRTAETVLERGLAYEGIVSLKEQNDREEALEIIRWVIGELSAVESPRVRQRMDLAVARERLSSWE
ncbi:hypothetical protein SAMN05920897_106115 [Alkalispirochaeta americana]|uniref:Tetratricopeptide repeat-containing protein n=1 Tax=Alkalispirochaeta americana TaxID=159291 RepID=A0A1N6RHM7_9SPIO|nr:hypothetical protein [Alkalispirochaeta americana]SIQ28307.1 hypothetical protein SAMN05920897_106115 [Alkalispirochaeta americana]